MGKGTLILPLGVGGGSGTQGAQGATGMQGATGLQGYTGIQGIAGDIGLQGVMGLQGISGADGIQGVQGTMGIQGAAGSGSEKIELMNLTPTEQLQFYNDVMSWNIKDFSNYTANGFQIVNAYVALPGWSVEWQSTTYVTDGTEVVLLMNPMLQRNNTGSVDITTVEYYTTLFSPTIVMTYGSTIDVATVLYGNIKPDWNASSGDANGILNKPALQTVSLQFTLGDSSVVNYDFYFNPQQ